MDKAKVVELAKEQIARYGKLDAGQHGVLEDIARKAGRDVDYGSATSEQSARQAVLNVLGKSGKFKMALEPSTLAAGKTVCVFYEKSAESEVGKAHNSPPKNLIDDEIKAMLQEGLLPPKASELPAETLLLILLRTAKYALRCPTNLDVTRTMLNFDIQTALDKQKG